MSAGQRFQFLIPDWVRNYKKEDTKSDLLAGVIVAIMLIPQSMAYALLAGLEPKVGLYAAILPLILYALFGSSRTLAVGPVAIVSLMVAHTLSDIAGPDPVLYWQLAILLAFMSGTILLLAGLFKLGFLANFIGHPVIAGFTSAAALIIGFSQFKHLLGVNLDRTHFIPSMLAQAFEKIGQINMATLIIAIIAITALLMKGRLTQYLQKNKFSDTVVEILPKSIPLFLVIFGTSIVWLFGLSGPQGIGVKVVGEVPQALPPVTVGYIFTTGIWSEHVMDLLVPALLISLIGFIESLSVAKSLAAKRREKITADKELVGLGAANLASSFTGGYAVTGGFSRSVVNFSAGAKTQLSSIVTAILIAIVVLLFASLLFHLPKAILAAIIIVAVANLVDFKPFFHAWKYNRPDGFAFLATFLSVLTLGVEPGITVGVAMSLGLYLWKTSQPHIAEVGRVGDTEHFRNIERHKVDTYKNLLLIRVDENLYFANTNYLEEYLLAKIADNPDVKDLVLIMNAVSYIDTSALEAIEMMVENLKSAGVTVHLAEVKGPVSDALKRTNLMKHLKPGKLFISTHVAVEELRGDQQPQSQLTSRWG